MEWRRVAAAEREQLRDSRGTGQNHQPGRTAETALGAAEERMHRRSARVLLGLVEHTSRRLTGQAEPAE